MLSRLVFGILAAVGCSWVAYGQAAAEYALQSSRGAVSAAGEDASIGGCTIGSTLLTCLSRSYPRTTILVVGLLAVIVWLWVAKMFAWRR